MPKPVYILCADNVSEDKVTNLVSIFGVLEKIRIKKGQRDPNQLPSPRLRFKSVAVWRREEGDPAEFELVTSVLISGKEEASRRGTLRFEEGKPLARTVADLILPPPDMARGCITIRQSLIDPSAGTSVSQEYSIDTEVIDRAQDAPSTGHDSEIA